MTAVTEAEVTAVHAPGAEIATYAAAQVEEYRPRFVMKPDEAKALDDQLRAAQRAILRENVDFGTIPGAGDKKNLLKPGAEKLLQWYGFGHRSVEVKIERDDPEHPSGIADKARRIGVTYRTEVIKTIHGHGEVVVATCEGYAGFDEDRYYITEDDARTKAKAKEEKNARKYRRDPESWKWETATEYRAPWNTLVKMAQKRSLVGAAILATGASGLFTQDMEDATPQASPEPEAAKFREAAMGALTALDKPILLEVGKWYRGKQWPDPREWTPEQWCTALQAAGFIAGQRAAGEAAKPAESEPSAYQQALARLDPEDAWTLRVQEITDDEDARIVLAEVSRSGVAPAKGHLIREVILVAWPGADSESEAA